MTEERKAGKYTCPNGIVHEKSDWCGLPSFDSETKKSIKDTLQKLLTTCCCPHGWTYSASECLSCTAKDTIRALCIHDIFIPDDFNLTSEDLDIAD